MLYPVKIEFKEYPSGSWTDWSQYLSEAPVISKRVESENEGEAGVIVFDNASVSFRYDSGNPVYNAFSIDLSSKQRYLFRISAVKTDKSYKQLFEGMADFSTIQWPDPDEGKLISFEVVDKLSALGILSSYPARVQDTLTARITAQIPAANGIRYFRGAGSEILYLSPRIGETPQNLSSIIIFPGEIVSIPIWVDSEVERWENYAVVTSSIVSYGGYQTQKVTVAPVFNDVAIEGQYVAELFWGIGQPEPIFYEKEIYGVDCNNYSAGDFVSMKGIEIMQALYAQAWPGETFIKKPAGLTFDVPGEYAVRLVTVTPFDTDPLGVLKILADTMKCYVYVNSSGSLVIHEKSETSLPTSGVTRSIGSTRIVKKPLRKYFWDKLVDGVTVEVESWKLDEYNEYLVGSSTQTKQAFPGVFIEPKNKIEKKLLTSVATEDTQEELDARAATEASAILDFYGNRHSSFELALNIDDNTLEWEIVDNMTIDSIACFFTQMEFDLVERILTLEPVEIAGHDYDFRQIVVGLSEANSLGVSSGRSYYSTGGGSGSGTYVFTAPLSESGGTVILENTGNLKVTSGQLDTIQDIKTTDTPTFSQINLSNAGSSLQAVRADRTVSAAYPLTGGGDLTADRELSLQFNAPLINNANYLDLDLTVPIIVSSNKLTLDYSAPMILSANKLTLDYNTTNLKLTANKLNTIQDINTTATPQFAKLGLGITAGSAELTIFEELSGETASAKMTSSEYVSGWTGAGWKMNWESGGGYTIETDNMFLRGSLTVYELIINQIRATNGTLIVSSAGRVASAYEPPPNGHDVEITFEDPTGHNLLPFAVNDILLMQRVNLSGSTIVKKIAVQVVSISTLTANCNYLYQSPGGSVPAAGDDFVRIGNTIDTDRQGVVYLTADDNEAPYIDIVDGVNSWASWMSATKVKARLGKLNGYTFAGSALTGYGFVSENAYLSGEVYSNVGGFGNTPSAPYIRINDKGLRIGGTDDYTPTVNGLSFWAFDGVDTYFETGVWSDAGYFRVGLADENRIEYDYSAGDFYLRGGVDNRNEVTSAVSTYWNYTVNDFVTDGLMTKWNQTNEDFETDAVGTDDLTGWTENWYTAYLDMHAGNGVTTAQHHLGSKSYLMKVTKDANAYPASKPVSYMPYYPLGTLGKTLTVSSSAAVKTYVVSIWAMYESCVSLGDLIVGIYLDDGNGVTSYSSELIPYSVSPSWIEIRNTIATDQSSINIEITWSSTGKIPLPDEGDSAGIYLDDFTIYDCKDFAEWSRTGIYLFSTPHRYAKIGTNLFELKGLDIDASDVVIRGNLIVYGNTLIEGEAALIPPGYNSTEWDQAYAWTSAGHIHWDTAYTHSQVTTGNPHNLDTGDIPEGSNLYYTDERVDDRVAVLMIAGNVTSWTYIDASGTLKVDVGYNATHFSVSGSLLQAQNFTITAGSGMTGGGSLTLGGSATLNVIGTTDRITVNADSIDIASTYAGQTSIITVGALTTGAINWSGNIDTSGYIEGNNFKVNASEVITSARALTNITAATVDNLSLDANRITTTTGNLELYSAGDVVFDPTGNDILPASNYDLNLGSETLKYLSLHAAELWVNTLVAQDTISTTGGRLLVTNATELVADINSTVTTITVKHNNLKTSDVIYLEKSGQIEFMQITSSYTPNGSNWDYTVTRDLDGTGGNSWLAGDAIVNTGQTGDGFMELYSHHSIKQNLLDSIYNYDDETLTFSSNYADSTNWVMFSQDATPDVGDIVYFGKDITFLQLHFYLGTAGVYDADFAYEYYNGVIWTALTNTTTPDFTGTGVIKWVWSTPALWTKTSINGVSKYWVRIRLTLVSSWTSGGVQSYQPVYEGGQQIGPTIVGYERDSNTFNDFSPRWAIGNLNGIYGYGVDSIGVAFGEYVDTSSYLTIDSTNGIRIINRVSGADMTVFSANMSGVTHIGNWIVDEYVLHDTNNYVVLKSGNDGSYDDAAGRILIDGYNGGAAYGVIKVGTGITISGNSSGIISIGDITVDGSSNGLITLGTSGKLRTSSGGDRIELYQNELLIYEAGQSTITKITQADWGMKIYQDYGQTYEQYIYYSNSGFEIRKEQTSGRYYVTRYGRITNDGLGFASLIYNDNATWTDTKYNFHIKLNGELAWYPGTGTGGTEDTNLYRSAANLLKTDDSFQAIGDIYTVAWSNYYSSSTITGWSAIGRSGTIYYKKIGKFVFVNFYITGTSSLTSVSFTLPYTNVNNTTAEIRTAIQFVNAGSGSNTSGHAYLDVNSNTVQCFSNWTTGSWTNSGTKTVKGQFFFEAQ